mmetsp:Transcript_61890/g.122367  ORF Transcript_61890/g.122367 Transcript_61890/m.122367 type:complete len:118 (+) Transcript_61890:306-659(+)
MGRMNLTPPLTASPKPRAASRDTEGFCEGRSIHPSINQSRDAEGFCEGDELGAAVGRQSELPPANLLAKEEDVGDHALPRKESGGVAPPVRGEQTTVQGREHLLEHGVQLLTREDGL